MLKINDFIFKQFILMVFIFEVWVVENSFGYNNFFIVKK